MKAKSKQATYDPISGIRVDEILTQKRDEDHPRLITSCKYFELFTHNTEKSNILIPHTIGFLEDKPAFWLFNSQKDSENLIKMRGSQYLNIFSIFEKFTGLKAPPEHKEPDKIIGYLKNFPTSHELVAFVQFENGEKLVVNSLELLQVLSEKRSSIITVQSIVDLKVSTFSTRESIYCVYRNDPKYDKEGPQVHFVKKSFSISNRRDYKALSAIAKKDYIEGYIDPASFIQEGGSNRVVVDSIFKFHLEECRIGNQVYIKQFGEEREPLGRVKNEIKRGYINRDTKKNYFRSGDHGLNQKIEELTKDLIAFIYKAYKIRVRKIISKFIVDSLGRPVFVGCKEIRFTCLPNNQYNHKEVLDLVGSGCILGDLIGMIATSVKGKAPPTGTFKDSDALNSEHKDSEPIVTVHKRPLSFQLFSQLISYECRGDFCEFYISNPEKTATGHENKNIVIQPANKAKLVLYDKLKEMIKKPYEIPVFMKSKCRNEFELLVKVLKTNHIMPKRLQGKIYGDRYDEHDAEIREILNQQFTLSQVPINLNQLYSNMKVCRTCYTVYSLMSSNFEAALHGRKLPEFKGVNSMNPETRVANMHASMRRFSMQEEKKFLATSGQFSQRSLSRHNSITKKSMGGLLMSERYLDRPSPERPSVASNDEENKARMYETALDKFSKTQNGMHHRSASVGRPLNQTERRKVDIVSSRLNLGLSSFKIKTKYATPLPQIEKPVKKSETYIDLYRFLAKESDFKLVRELAPADTLRIIDEDELPDSEPNSILKLAKKHSIGGSEALLLSPIRGRATTLATVPARRKNTLDNAKLLIGNLEKIAYAVSSVSKVTSVFYLSLDNVRKLDINKITTPKAVFNVKYRAIREFIHLPVHEFCKIKKIQPPNCNFSKQINFFVYNEDIGIPYLVIDSIDQNLQASKTDKARVKTLLICNDCFDSFTEYIPIYQHFLQSNKNYKIVLFNLPGQAFSAYNPDVISNNDQDVVVIDTLLSYLQSDYKINFSEEEVYMIGFGFGANILSLLAHSFDDSLPYFKGLLMVNGFTSVDEPMKEFFQKMDKVLDHNPTSLIDLPYNYYNIQCGGHTMTRKEYEEKEIANPISIKDRKYMIKCVCNSIDITLQTIALKAPVFIVHSIKNCIVRLSNIETLLEKIEDDKDPAKKMLKTKALRHMIDSDLAGYPQEYPRKSFFYDGPHNLLDEMPLDALKIIQDFIDFTVEKSNN